MDVEIALIVARYMVVFLKRPGGQSQFSAHLTAQSADKGPIQAITDYILTNLRSDLSVDTLAGRANMSPRNFSRVFFWDIGVTPADSVELARSDSARRDAPGFRAPCSASRIGVDSPIFTTCAGSFCGPWASYQGLSRRLPDLGVSSRPRVAARETA